MRAFSMFLCMFLLFLSSGTVTYVYLVWSSYWKHVEMLAGDYGDDVGGVEGRPPAAKELLELKRHEKRILDRLEALVVETGRSVLAGGVENKYGVEYPRRLRDASGPDSGGCCCGLNMTTFRYGDPFFSRLQLGRYLPKRPLDLAARKPSSCGVVSSAGSLLRSRLGGAIDANDYVIRFNDAPTEGYEPDVGSRTDLRIVNSQVVGKPEYGFLDDRLYSDVPVLVWDPSGYNASLEEWYASPDVPFFEAFFARRLMRPEPGLHLLHPRSVWAVWDWLQGLQAWPMLPNPPSSGFIGLVLALRNCAVVNVYEFVPSMRMTDRCHYYDLQENVGCTVGEWHPLAAEKLAAVRMNVGDEVQVYSKGYITIRGADCT